MPWMRNPHAPPNHPAIGLRQPRCSHRFQQRDHLQFRPDLQWVMAGMTKYLLSEPIKLTHIRVTLPPALVHERPASFVIEGLWGRLLGGRELLSPIYRTLPKNQLQLPILPPENMMEISRKLTISLTL